jgi:hypothetical protein
MFGHISKSVVVLILASHLSAMFDAWSTRRFLSRHEFDFHPAYETNPEYRWASRGPQMYLAIEDKAIITTLLLSRTKPGTWQRKVAIAGCVGVTILHLQAGIANLRRDSWATASRTVEK